MKNREFLNLIGSVNEGYIQAADSKVVRPRCLRRLRGTDDLCLSGVSDDQPAAPQLHSDGAWRHDEYVGRREYCDRRTGRHR